MENIWWFFFSLYIGIFIAKSHSISAVMLLTMIGAHVKNTEYIGPISSLRSVIFQLRAGRNSDDILNVARMANHQSTSPYICWQHFRYLLVNVFALIRTPNIEFRSVNFHISVGKISNMNRNQLACARLCSTLLCIYPIYLGFVVAKKSVLCKINYRINCATHKRFRTSMGDLNRMRNEMEKVFHRKWFIP